MPKVLIEIKSGTVTNVETTLNDVEIYAFDHDIIREGSIGELKRYLADASEPIEVDCSVPEDELVTRLEDLIAAGQATLDDMRGAWDDDEELEEAEELNFCSYAGRL